MTRPALLEQLPALTAFYGLKPWEVELLTMAELDEYLRQMAEAAAEKPRPENKD